MGATITEKILANAADLPKVTPGEIINVRVDGVIGHDITTAAFRELEKMKVKKVFDPEKIYFTADHYIPSPTQEAAAQLKDLNEYIRRYQIKHFFAVGRGGICHALFPEEGLIKPGTVIVGSDSHTCTYGALGAFSTGMGATDVAAAMALGEIWLKVPASLRFVYENKLKPWVTGKDLILFTIGQIGVDGALYKTMEFTGEAIRALPMDERFTICNMAIEAGAKSGIMEPDEITFEYVRERVKGEYIFFTSDTDAQYESEFVWDASKIEPVVAQPPSPANVVLASDVKGVQVHQVVIGSCTNGRITDLRAAATLLKGRKVSNGTRLLIIPATQKVYLQAAKEGLLEIFVEAGGFICPPTCGPCFGGHMGLLADGEVAVSTTNRNFTSRMGHKNSKVYLASSFTAAASAIAGYIIDPREVV